jgi:hypothetical protein
MLLGTAVKWQDRTFVLRMVDPSKIGPQTGPEQLAEAIRISMTDQIQMIWLSMAALAKDVYSRGEGTREFEAIVKQLGLKLADIEGKPLDVGGVLGT